MANASENTAPSRPRPISAIFVGGLIVGVLDLAYAILVYSPRQPILIPQTIASGLLGPDRAYTGGVQTAILGTILHFVIACGAAAVYYLASRRFSLLAHQAVSCGLIFGALVYIFMHTVVLPLSAVPKGHMPLFLQVCEFVWHWFGVGLPISLSVRHYSR